MEVVENSPDFFIIEDKELSLKYTNTQEIYKKYRILGQNLYIAKYSKLGKDGFYLDRDTYSRLNKIKIPIIIFLAFNIVLMFLFSSVVIKEIINLLVSLIFGIFITLFFIKSWGVYLKQITKLVFDKRKQSITVSWYNSEGSYQKTFAKSDVQSLRILTADTANTDGTIDYQLFITFDGETLGHQVAFSYNKEELIRLKEKMEQSIGLSFN